MRILVCDAVDRLRAGVVARGREQGGDFQVGPYDAWK
jgi:hypothetical protein